MTSSTATMATAMTERNKTRILRALGLVMLLGCGTEESAIPPIDGRLVLDVRYPTSKPVAATDSISFWGTVGTGKARLRVNGRSVHVAPNGGFAGFVPFPVRQPFSLSFEATRGVATATKVIPLTVITNRPTPPLAVRPARDWHRLRRLPTDTLDPATQARPIYSRWTPGGGLALPLPQGARLPADGETDEAIRLRLASGLLVWVPREDAEPVAPPPEPARIFHGLRLTSSGGRAMLELAVAEPVPSAVEVIGTRMRWTLFGVRPGRIDRFRSAEGLVRDVIVRELADGRVTVDITLVQSLLGWRTRWRNGRATLELRPTRAAGAGLAGLVVALDPGHPPEGTTGPTGLKEDSMSLAVAVRTAARLRSLGARPVLTRATPDPVSLEARVVAAEAADADLLISIHANAPAEGRPPWSVDGTRVYWLSPRAAVLAGVMQDSVATATGQVRAGTFESNLAVLRSPWFPSVLIEATAMTMPVREAYLRSERGIEAYASGIVAGIKAWVAKQ